MAQIPEIDDGHFDGNSNIGRSKGDEKFLARIIRLAKASVEALEARSSAVEAAVSVLESAMSAAQAAILALQALHTADGGKAIWMINDTGAPTVKGTVVEVGSVTNSFKVSDAACLDPIGVVYDAGIADGELCRIVVGGKAYVLIQDSTTATIGNWAKTSETQAGRADMTATPPVGGTLQQLADHFQEIGHCIETVNPGGTDKLALAVIHCN